MNTLILIQLGLVFVSLIWIHLADSFGKEW